MGGGCLDNAAQGIQTTGEPVAVVYSAKLGVLIVQSREPAQLLFYTASGSSLGTLLLATSTVADTGHAVFHSNAGASIACASCHAEGAEDGHIWTFAETGPRRTQSLRGGILGTEPFHWDGDMRDLSMIMDQVFVRRMSGPSLASDQKEGLSRFIEGIPRLPAPPVFDPAAVARGKALFEDTTKAACVSCHSGTRMTNNTTVDVGTKGSFQVPSLLGVGWRTPVMHDGCAATLSDRFNPTCGGAAHGNTAKLSVQDKADLVSYMQTL